MNKSCSVNHNYTAKSFWTYLVQNSLVTSLSCQPRVLINYLVQMHAGGLGTFGTNSMDWYIFIVFQILYGETTRIYILPTWMRSHWDVRRVVFSWRKMTAMLYWTVTGGGDPRCGAVYQRAPLRQEVGRRSKIPSLHTGERWIIRNPAGRPK